MAKEDISDLLSKIDNHPDDPEGKLTAQEFVRLVRAVRQNQDGVKGISVNGANLQTPDENGNVNLSISLQPGTSYTAALDTPLNTSAILSTSNLSLSIPLRFVGKRITVDGRSTNIGANGTLYIERSIDGLSWTQVGTTPIPSKDENSVETTDIAIGQYLSEGAQMFRFQVKFQYIDDDGATHTAQSEYVTFNSVLFIKMSLTFFADWGSAFSGNSVPVSFYVSGYGQMYLYVKCDDTVVVDGTPVTASTESAVEVFIDNNRSWLTNGSHSVTAWLTSALDPNLQSDICRGSFLFFDENTATDIQKNSVFFTVNNLSSLIHPYVEEHLLDFSIFKYGAANVSAKLLIMNGNRTVTYASYDLGSIDIGVQNSFANAVPIPSGVGTVYVYFSINDVIQTSQSWSIAVDSSVDYSPTTMNAGGFILDPSTRSNNEDHPEVMINSLNGEVVASEWSENMSFVTPNGYVKDADGLSCLHINAETFLKITGYDPFSQLASSNSTASVTMEFDIKVSNVYNDKEPIIVVGRDVATFLGLKIFPSSAYVLTQNRRSIGEQDIHFQEDERTHIAINIFYNLGNQGLNYIRLFINGIINREFLYKNDVFASELGSGGIRIGSSSADVDIYGIRIYKQQISSHNIIQDYKSSIPNAEKKALFHRANNILGGSNTIDYTAASALYSTMLWIPNSANAIYPCLENKDKSFTKGTLKLIFRYRYDIVDSRGVSHLKGEINTVLSRVYTNMKVKGQGTSSSRYWYWNWRFQFSDNSTVEDLNGNILLQGADCYMLFEEDGAHVTKADAKYNWASSSQSHKMGMVNSYGTLWKEIIKNQSAIYSADSKTRPCVLQEAFLFFIQDDPNQASSIRFSNFFTFGPAKNDKATWGSKIKSPHYVVEGSQKSLYTLLEGSANDRVLVEGKVPWIPEEVFYYFNEADDTDDKNETFLYNNASQFDFDGGPSNTQTYGNGEEYDTPKGFTYVGNNMWKETEDMSFDSLDPYKVAGGNTIKFYRRAWNLIYLCTPYLDVIEGGYSALQTMANNNQLSTAKQYFITAAGSGHESGDCFRYNPLSGTWVNAGITKNLSTADGYAVLNLFTDLAEFLPSSFSHDPVTLKETFIAARLARYKAQSGNWWRESDCDLCQVFGKVNAAKDNWCKNTYFKLEPDGLLCMNRDDDDTIFDKDNVGRTGTPYQVEEHDKYNAAGEWADEDGRGEVWDSETGEYNLVQNLDGTYFNSNTCALFILRELTRETEMKSMMTTMFSKMAELEGSVEGFYQKYFFDIQEYLPAVAYNEVARLGYEVAAKQMDLGNYTNGTHPMTQSLGDQLQGEKQWIKMRIPYMESFAHSGTFYNANNTLQFRSAITTAEAAQGGTHTYYFKLTPHQFLYPIVGSEGVKVFSDRRARPGELVEMSGLTVGRDIDVFIYGINYLRSVGDFAPHPTAAGSSISVVSKRLSEWIINEDGSSLVENQSSTISFTCPHLQRLIMRGCAQLSSLPTISNLSQLREIDLRECSLLTSVSLPQSFVVRSVMLPENLTSLVIENMPNLETLRIESAEHMTSLVLRGVGNLGRALVEKCHTEEAPLEALVLTGISWNDVRRDFLMWVTSLPSCTLTGSIVMSTIANLSLADLYVLFDKYGNIRDESNALYIEYTAVMIERLSITGQKYFPDRCVTKFGIATDIGNNLKFVNGKPALMWQLAPEAKGIYMNIDSATGEAQVIETTPNETTRYRLTVTAELLNGDTISAYWNIGFFNRLPQRGDFAYADGTFDDEYRYDKTVVGFVVRVSGSGGAGSTRTIDVVAKENANLKSSDGTINNTASLPWGIYPSTDANGFNSDIQAAIREHSRDVSLYSFATTGSGSGDFSTAVKSAAMVDRANEILSGWIRYVWGNYDLPETPPAYNTENTYTSGNVVRYSSALYMCKAVSTTGTFDTSSWSLLTPSQYGLMRWAKEQSSSNSHPNNRTELADMMVALSYLQNALGTTNSTRFYQLFYPAVYACKLYEPAVKEGEILDARYARENWMLPACGMVNKIYGMYHASRNKVSGGTISAQYANESQEGVQDVDYPLMANILKRLADAGEASSIFTWWSNSHFWSASEYNTTNSYYVYFQNGNVNYYGKYSSCVVRAVTAFTYTL